MDNNQKHSTGSLKISKEVLATIARVAALEIEGVAGLAEPTGSVSRLFNKGIGKTPIQIELNDDFAKISLTLNLTFGAKITEVCAAVQNAVKENVQMMTGMAVSKVNVTVVGIVFPQQETPDQE